MDIPTVERQEKILSKINLSKLTSKQRKIMENVIGEEWEVFLERDYDVGENSTYRMETNFKDSNPVQRKGTLMQICKIWQYLGLHMKIICRIFHIKTPFTF